LSSSTLKTFVLQSKNNPLHTALHCKKKGNSGKASSATSVNCLLSRCCGQASYRVWLSTIMLHSNTKYDLFLHYFNNCTKAFSAGSRPFAICINPVAERKGYAFRICRACYFLFRNVAHCDRATGQCPRDCSCRFILDENECPVFKAEFHKIRQLMANNPRR